MTFEKLPVHIAIIMDGNGRWAQAHHLPRFQGHLEGVKRAEEIMDAASEIGIKVLTLYTFSTENWRRPASEVNMLMKTVCSVLEEKTQKLQKMNVQIHFSGRREGVPEEVLKSIDKAMRMTQKNDGLILNLAFNYGGRQEIVDAVKKIAAQIDEKKMQPQEIDEQVIQRQLYTAGLPDPDFLIRTSGEQRISNFLLWQLSYAEFYFTETCWPDFDRVEFEKALLEYQRRQRRYGKISAS